MKYRYADVLKITDDFLRYADGNCKMWLMGVWTIIEKNGLNKCCSDLERLRFYAVLYGACRIYSHFSDLISDTYFNDDIYLDIDYKKFSMLKDGDIRGKQSLSCFRSFENIYEQQQSLCGSLLRILL